MALVKRQRAERRLRRYSDTKRQQATAEEADRPQSAAALRRHCTGDNVVVGIGDDAADECKHRPQNEEQSDQPTVRKSGAEP